MSTKIVAARLATSAGVTTVITRASNPGNISRIAQHVQASRSPGEGHRSPGTRSRSSSVEKHPAEDEPAQPQGTSTSTTLASRPRAHSNASSASSSSSASEKDQQSYPPAPLPLHTRFLPSPQPIRDRSFWILHGLRPHGDVYIDGGCYKALLGKAGLLPAGVVDVEGGFSGHECVRLLVVERRRGASGDAAGEAGEGQQQKKEKAWRGEPRDVGRAIVNYSSAEITRIMGHQSREIEGLLGYADSGYVAEREHITFFQSRPQTPTPITGVVESEAEKA